MVSLLALLLVAGLFLVLPRSLNRGQEGVSDSAQTFAKAIRSLAALEETRIFFAHQSVGYNLVQGMGDIAALAPGVQWPVLEWSGRLPAGGGAFLHDFVGENGHPRRKIDAFGKMLATGLGEHVDIALMKFCYLDIHRGTDVPRLFAYYVQKMAELKTKYPRVRFVHVTVPLEGRPVGPVAGMKHWLKVLLGRGSAAVERNARREAFNDRLRQYFKGKEPCFDLARAESVDLDGSRCRWRYRDREYPCLVGRFTDDGEHLNGVGRKILAARFLDYLARTARGISTGRSAEGP